MRAKKHIVDDGQFADDLGVLECSDESEANDLMRRHAVEQVLATLLIRKADFARVGFVELRDAVEHRGFARAVRADESVDFVAVITSYSIHYTKLYDL